MARDTRVSFFIEFVMAMCRLWPKHNNLSHFNIRIAATMLLPLSVVMQAKRFSERHHDSNVVRSVRGQGSLQCGLLGQIVFASNATSNSNLCQI